MEPSINLIERVIENGYDAAYVMNAVSDIVFNVVEKNDIDIPVFVYPLSSLAKTKLSLVMDAAESRYIAVVAEVTSSE